VILNSLAARTHKGRPQERNFFQEREKANFFQYLSERRSVKESPHILSLVCQDNSPEIVLFLLSSILRFELVNNFGPFELRDDDSVIFFHLKGVDIFWEIFQEDGFRALRVWPFLGK